jgi:hypothetical protein
MIDLYFNIRGNPPTDLKQVNAFEEPIVDNAILTATGAMRMQGQPNRPRFPILMSPCAE